ncbi:MAG: tyrosine-type recombinase/integrase [Propionibacteriales bacterium]|nr:tyrosine-type recombinase/integrase [Propionibacteriales bacterium]
MRGNGSSSRALVVHSASSGDNSDATVTPVDDDWEDWVRDWELSLRARTRGVSEQTLTAYKTGVRQFVAFMDAKAPEDVTRRDVEAFLAHLASRGRSEATRRLRLMAVRSLFGFILGEPGSLLSGNPADGIAAPVPELPDVDVIPDTDLVAVLGTCDATFLGLRDAAIIRLMLATGLRRTEVCMLDVDDIDISHGEAAVLGKGGKRRVVAFGGSRLPLALSRYVRARRRHLGAADPALFLSQRAKARNGYRMNGGAIAAMLRRRCRAAGVKVWRPHMLRHTWADNAKRQGLSDEDLERMAGWTSPGMSRRYGRQLADERARAALRGLNLGDRL